MIEHAVTAPDGRRLQVAEDGVPDGVPVLIHNGTPGSRLLYRPAVALAAGQGIRLISYDRPGYGRSTPLPGRSVGDCAADVRAIAEALGIERLLVWGISGGGPHALACAALLGDLVPAVAALAASAPYGAEGLDYFAGMGELNVEDIKLLLSDRTAARRRFEAERLEMLRADASSSTEMIEDPPLARRPGGVQGRACRLHGGRDQGGPRSRGRGLLGRLRRRRGFELESIRTPVLLLHGRHDRFVPFGHGEWLARHVPGVEAWLLDDDGHITLTARHLGRVHEWLLERF